MKNNVNMTLKSTCCDSPTSTTTEWRSTSIDPSVIVQCVPTSRQFMDCSYWSVEWRVAFFPLSSSNVVYSASPVDDPNAYKGAVVISSPVKPSSNTVKVSKMFACANPLCNYKCNRITEMREHIKQHPFFKQYRCLYPGCTFTSSVLKDMTFHYGYHTGERPYRCTFAHCGFAAPNPSQLRLHMVSHSDDKPFKCSFDNCTYATRYKSALINHERTHTGEKPYKCKYCKSFSAKQKSGLQYHIKTVHMCK